MSQDKLLRLAAFSALLAIHFHVSSSSGFNNISIPYNCTQVSSCGNILNISYPFRLKGDSPNCGDSNYELSCENNQTILSLHNIFSLEDKRFLVKAIDYHNSTIRIADPGVQAGDCSSRPINPLYYSDVRLLKRDGECLSILWYSPYEFRTPYNNIPLAIPVAYVSCESPVNSSTYVDVNSPCIIQTKSTNNRRSYHYVLVGGINYTDLKPSCAIDFFTYTTLDGNYNNYSYMDIHKKLVYGFEFSWERISCVACGGDGFCRLQNNTIIQNCGSEQFCFKCGLGCKLQQIFLTLYYWVRYRLNPTGELIRHYRDINLEPYYWFWILLALLLAVRTLFGFLCLSVLVIYKWRRKHLSMDDTLEEFLKSQNNFMPIRYSYSQIKKMSGRFQEKLGEGGYGSVFKGKLRSGRLVAIKILGKAKGHGQDFINEVATIGRIHHVNVVSLVGFCSDGTKRALVYDFMPKGSLDKYVLSRDGHVTLSWKKMFEISLGVARGIEYLHRGCDIQILHFDIKPHNILLDENFIPKISDFGLAKLYSTADSIVSLTVARGTIGYIAPELIYKRIGGVSYKADVYSFGMLLMEMSGKRKKLDATTDNNSSQTYFPLWVYHEMVQGKTTEDEDTIEGEEENMIKKMTIVGLWCIQIRPCDRPSMRKVIQMLEGDVENLKLPPEPTCNIEQVPVENVEEVTNPIWSSWTSIGASESVRLVVDAD